MDIPDFVKIKGKIVPVTHSGRGYVIINDSISDLRVKYKTRNEWERLIANENDFKDAMYKCFEEALKLARKGIKNI